MRLGMFVSLAFALMLSVWSTPSVAAVGSSHDATVVALQQPSSGGATPAQPGGKLDVDINVNHHSIWSYRLLGRLRVWCLDVHCQHNSQCTCQRSGVFEYKRAALRSLRDRFWLL